MGHLKNLRNINNAQLASFILSFALFMYLSLDNIFSVNLATYSPAEFHFFDKNLFPSNLDNLSNGLSPRIGSFFIMKSLMSLGFTYEWSYFLIVILICIISGLSVSFFANAINRRYTILIAIITTFMLFVSRLGIVGGFTTFSADSLFLGLGLSLITLGIVLLKYYNYYSLAFILVSLSAICHIHEGIWGFLIMFIISAYNKKFEIIKIWSLYLSIIIILLLTLSNVLDSSTIDINQEEFFHLYVIERLPHHLLLRYIGIKQIGLLLCSYILIIIYCFRKTGTYKFLNFLLLISCITLSFWYLTVDCLHLNFFVKLYIGKFIKYISILFIFEFIKTLSYDLENKSFSLFICTSLLLHPLLWLLSLLILIILDKIQDNKKNILYNILSVANIIVSVMVLNYGKWALLLLTVLCIIYSFNKCKIIRLSTIPIVCFLLIINLYCSAKPSSIYGIPTSLLAEQSERNVYEFANEFKNISKPEETFICDPYSNASCFIQHVSRRSSFVLWKTVPSYEKGIIEWNKRVKSIPKWDTISEKTIISIMKKNRIKYLVDNDIRRFKDNKSLSVILHNNGYILYKLNTYSNEK